MTGADYYDTGVDGPVRLTEYRGIRDGDRVVYENPAWQQPDGTYKTGGMDGVYTVSALYQFGPDDPVCFPADPTFTQAVLDDGTWEVNADNLRKVDA